ncbi:MAG: class I SAM-dependent methyltransferase [Chloroflexota bacterium]|nr:class I SAM-dependent methyltransferase [Chloroflexota bacterium]
MIEGVFGPEYAAAYDHIYRDKDYPAECDAVEQTFGLYGLGPVRRVLDLGCGTGGHALVLATRGYDVLGVDRSPSMLERARERETTARFELGDIVGLDLGETFDAVLMMFAVLGYHTANVDVQAALATVRRHLRPGGLFLCDVWYGPAVLHERPGERARVLGSGGSQIIRVARGELDERHHVCNVRYHLWRLENGTLVAEVREQHRMRFFFPLELELLLGAAGLELVKLADFPRLEDEPSNATWNIAVIARAL